MTDSTTNSSDDIVPSGLSIEHNQVRHEVWENIQHWLSSNMLPSSISNPTNLIYVPISWETGTQMQGRRIAQFGNCRYDYIRDVAEYCNVDEDNNAYQIPNYIYHTLLHGQKNSKQYTQCIINMYEAENEIPWHLDHELFGPEVLVYTFGEDRPLRLRKLHDTNTEANRHTTDTDDGSVYTQVYPKHCSKYVLSGPARHVWEHSVPSGKSDRVSITFRSWIGPK